MVGLMVARLVSRMVAKLEVRKAELRADQLVRTTAGWRESQMAELMDMMMADCSAEQLASMTVGQWAHC